MHRDQIEGAGELMGIETVPQVLDDQHRSGQRSKLFYRLGACRAATVADPLDFAAEFVAACAVDEIGDIAVDHVVRHKKARAWCWLAGRDRIDHQRPDTQFASHIGTGAATEAVADALGVEALQLIARDHRTGVGLRHEKVLRLFRLDQRLPDVGRDQVTAQILGAGDADHDRLLRLVDIGVGFKSDGLRGRLFRTRQRIVRTLEHAPIGARFKHGLPGLAQLVVGAQRQFELDQILRRLCMFGGHHQVVALQGHRQCGC